MTFNMTQTGVAEISRAVGTANRIRVLAYLQARTNGVSFAGLASALDLSDRVLRRVLNRLAEDGRAHKNSEGRWHATRHTTKHVTETGAPTAPEQLVDQADTQADTRPGARHAQICGGGVKAAASTRGPQGEKTMQEWLAKVEQGCREALQQAKDERDEARSRLADVAVVIETWADVDLDEATGEDLFQLWEAVKLAAAPKEAL